MAFKAKRLFPKFPQKARKTFTRSPSCDEEIRIVLIGKTGNGKSASGNTLLNRDAFSPGSGTAECNKARGTVHGQRIAVIDTPGLFDTKYKERDVLLKLKTCISMSAPGPHVFLIVIRLDRFTEEEQRSVELIQQVFGDKAADYSMVLFTYGEQLQDTPPEAFTSQSSKLTNIIQACDGRCHVFNNKDPSCSQVPQLLEKVERTVQNNGGSYYTNEMIQEAERAVQEAAGKFENASAENKRRAEEALKAKHKGEKLQSKLKELERKYKMQAREKAEKKNKYIFPGLFLTAAEIGL